MPKPSVVEITSKLPKIDKRARLFILGAVVLLLLASIPSYYFYSENQKLKNPAVLSTKEVENLVEKVGKLIELPKNEDPTVATVSDKSKLADQEFFRNAQNGDKVLIYTKAKKAILYRPSTNKIIEVAPVNLGQNLESSPAPSANASPSPSASPEKAKTYTVVLYNGSTTIGLTKTYEGKIEAEFPIVQVADRDNAAKDNYKDTIVINLTKADSTVAAKLAEITGGEVGSLPSGETKPSGADFLIILAK